MQIPDSMRQAIELTKAGRLVEATAAIQKSLGNGAVDSPSGGIQSPRTPPTIEGTAETVSDTATPQKTRRPRALGKVSLRDLVRPAKRLFEIHKVGEQEDSKFKRLSYRGPTGARNYKIYVPSGYQTGTAIPLIVMLHGCTQSADDFAAGTRMNEVAEYRTFIVAYPEQGAADNMQRCWKWFIEEDQQRGHGEPAIIAGITQDIMTRYSVDASRVFIAGLSAGGAMAAVLGEAYPELYAAIGVHSGLACGAAHDIASAFSAMRNGASGAKGDGLGTSRPTIVFHGDRDSTVNIRNGDAVVAQAVGGTRTTVSSEMGSSPGGLSFVRKLHRDSRGRLIVEQWTIHGAPHAWAGGSPFGSYTDPRGPNATEAMVRFFME